MLTFGFILLLVHILSESNILSSFSNESQNRFQQCLKRSSHLLQRLQSQILMWTYQQMKHKMIRAAVYILYSSMIVLLLTKKSRKKGIVWKIRHYFVFKEKIWFSVDAVKVTGLQHHFGPSFQCMDKNCHIFCVPWKK